MTYLLEWYICKIPYVGKSETSFNIRFINQRKDIKNNNSILARKSFNRRDHGSNNHRKLSIKEQLRNITTATTEAFFKRKTKAVRKRLDNKIWDFDTTGSEPKSKMKPNYADNHRTNITCFRIVIRNRKIVCKHGPCCWYFCLNLKFVGWQYREYSKKWLLSVRTFFMKMTLGLF